MDEDDIMIWNNPKWSKYYSKWSKNYTGRDTCLFKRYWGKMWGKITFHHFGQTYYQTNLPKTYICHLFFLNFFETFNFYICLHIFKSVCLTLCWVDFQFRQGKKFDRNKRYSEWWEMDFDMNLIFLDNKSPLFTC